MSTLRLPAALAALLVACSGGSGEDPCTISTGGVSVSPPGSPLGDAARLDCTGTAGGTTLQCAGEARVEQTTCSDGFAFALESGNVRLLLRLKGGESWTAGARIAGLEDVEGSLSMSGLFDPSSPVPASGQAPQKGAFALHGAASTLDGTFAASAW